MKFAAARVQIDGFQYVHRVVRPSPPHGNLTSLSPRKPVPTGGHSPVPVPSPWQERTHCPCPRICPLQKLPTEGTGGTWPLATGFRQAPRHRIRPRVTCTHSFLRPRNVPSYAETTFCLSANRPTDLWEVTTVQLLRISLLRLRARVSTGTQVFDALGYGPPSGTAEPDVALSASC